VAYDQKKPKAAEGTRAQRKKEEAKEPENGEWRTDGGQRRREEGKPQEGEDERWTWRA